MGVRGGKLTTGTGISAPSAAAAADARIRRALAAQHYLLPEEGAWLAQRIVELERELEVLRRRRHSRRRSEHTAERPDPAP